MIKVGDKLHHQGKEWNVEFAGEPFVHLKHGDDFIIESSHIFWNKLYAEQKQRADELEKRWSALRDYLEERIETSKVDCEDNKYIYSRYKTCKNTLFKMQQLEENNNA